VTDAGYVLGGYAVTTVAIGGYVGHMWARTRALAHAAPTRSDEGPGTDRTTPDEDR
jgi:hypothetical protein